jgi:hypothetical protein
MQRILSFSKPSHYLFALAYLVLFALAYSQWPVFSGNQNTKFIVGLAAGGYGDIASDWMAGISDPFPLFSFLLQWQYKLVGVYFSTHIAFCFLLAIYGYAGLRIAGNFLVKNDDYEKVFGLVAILWFVINIVVIRNWLDDFLAPGLAGQYIFGSTYQPATFGVLFFSGLLAYESRKLYLAALCFALAPLFHPAYILGSFTIVASIVILPSNKRLGIDWTQRLKFLVLFLIIMVPYSFWISSHLTSGDPALQHQAHDLLANIRIPHHAIPQQWDVLQTTLYFSVGFAAAVFARKHLAGQLLFPMLVVIGVSVLIALYFPNNTVAVVAPWRMSVITAPIAWLIWLVMISRLAVLLFNKVWKGKFPSMVAILTAVTLMVAGSSAGVLRLAEHYEKKKTAPHSAISEFIKENHIKGNTYAVPIREMNLRLAAGVPVLATWKSHPTKDSELLEWFERVKAARSVSRKNPASACREVSFVRDRYSVTHLVMISRKIRGEYPSTIGIERYADKYYTLIEIHQGDLCKKA